MTVVVAGLAHDGDRSPVEASTVGAARVSASAVRVDPPDRQVSIIAGGDVLPESRVRDAAAAHGLVSGRRFDFRPMFAPVAEVLHDVDLAICNQELPIGTPGAPVGYNGRSLYGGNRLIAPYELAADLAAVGFDRCSTATNHALDGGLIGIASTIEAHDAAGISTVGTARSPGEAALRVIDTGQALVGHLSLTNSLNDPAPSDPWRLEVRPGVAKVVADARALRSMGAEVVVVSLHIGVELLEGPTLTDRSFVTQLAASGAIDAVFVHGPHVVQPFEMVHGTAVWWSLGNFVSQMGPPSIGRYATPRASDGLLARVDFVRGDDGRWRMTPMSIAICNDSLDRTVRRATTELARTDIGPRVRLELEGCLARTRRLVPDAR